MASATFGLVLGGLIGGPVARKLVNNLGRKPVEKQNDNVVDTVVEVFENAGKQRFDYFKISDRNNGFVCRLSVVFSYYGFTYSNGLVA